MTSEATDETIVVGVVRLLADGHGDHAAQALSQLDPASAYAVLRALARILADAGATAVPTAPGDWRGVREGEHILRRQCAGDVPGSQFAAWLLATSQDPELLVGAGMYLAAGCAALVRTGFLPWPDVQLSTHRDRN